jgi:hypothetical protein
MLSSVSTMLPFLKERVLGETDSHARPSGSELARRTVKRSVARWLCLALSLCLLAFGCASKNSRTIAVIPGTTATEFWEAAQWRS